MTITNEDNMKLMKRYPDNYFDLAIVDPPYFSGPEKRKYYGSAESNHGVKRIDYKPLEESWEIPDIKYYNELIRVSKDQIIWGINYFDFVSLSGPGRIIWDKINDGSTFSSCEIASCSKNKIRTDIFRFMWRGMMQGSTADGTKMNGDKSKNQKKIHPTQKPIQLYEWLLMNYAMEGEQILDTHLGSGSIAIACHNLGFDLTACELDKEYFDAAMKRIENHKAQLRIF